MIELSEFQTDALCECINIGIGDAAAVLSELAGEEIKLEIPAIKTIHLNSVRDYLDNHYTKWHSCVLLEFNSQFSGDAVLIFNQTAANGWAKLISSHQFDTEIDLTEDMKNDFLLEIGNILINGCIGSLSNMMNIECDFSIPHLFTKITSDLFDDMLDRDQTEHFGMIVTTTLTAEGQSVTTDLFLTLKEDSLPFFIKSIEELLGL